VGPDEFTDIGQYLFVVSSFLEFQNPRRDWVRRDANNPTTPADINIHPDRSLSGHSIVIDTSPPMLNSAYGVQTDHSDGLFYPGEEIRLSIQFNKPVAVSGDAIYLVLDCGPKLSSHPFNGFAFIDKALPDNVTIEFVYVVEQYVNTSGKSSIPSLEIQSGGAALVVLQNQNAYIRRKTLSPLTDAELNSESVFGSLSASHTIQLDGFPPVVNSVSVVSTDPPFASSLYPDDSVLLEVQFSAPIVANCSPVLVLAVRYYREAEYVSGNGSDTFTFK